MNGGWLRRRFRLAVLTCCAILAVSDLVEAERLPLQVFTIADGLGHNDVNKIVRDSRGFIWFCTAGGLSKFDGYTFTNYGTDQGLPHSNVTDLLETRTGDYWVGTAAGIVRFNPKGVPIDHTVHEGDADAAAAMFTVLATQDPGESSPAVTVLLEDRRGTIWCGTTSGLSQLDRSEDSFRLRPVDIRIPSDYPEQSIIADLLEDRYGSLWIATPSGLYRRGSGGELAHYTQHDGLPNDYLQDLFEDDQGRLWVSTRLGGFFRLIADGTQKTPLVAEIYTKQNGLPANWVFQLFETDNHKFWVATNGGLVEFYPDGDEQGQHFRAYITRNGLSYNEITALAEDLGGNLWLGTNTAGAMRLIRNGFVTYDEQDAIFQVSAIFGDRTGAVCFKGNVLGDGRTSVFEGAKLELLSSEPPNLYQRFGCFSERHFEWFKPRVFFEFGWVMEGVTLQAHDGEWWVGSGAGVYRFPAANNFSSIKTTSPIAVYSTREGLATNQVFRLFEDSRYDIWISTISAATNGLSLWERASGKLRDLKDAPGLPSIKENLPRSFGEDGAGQVWIGFNHGLARYTKGAFKYFTSSDGLPPGAIMNIYRDHAGRVWLASARSGLIRIDDAENERPSFVNYTTAQGLTTNNIEVITEDAEGYIYVGGGNGLDRLDPATAHIKHFGTADGLAPGLFRAAFRDEDGVLWFGMTRGVSRFVPVTAEPQPPPKVLITGVRVAGAARLLSALGEKEITLPDSAANDNQRQFDFVALAFVSGEVLRYQFKLEGADTEWSVPSEQRTVNYANLAPGRYRFLVRAINSDGILTQAPASVTFTILRPVWQRWWFLTLVAFAIALGVHLLYRYRVSRLMEFANMRTRIASDLHDDIGSGLSRMAILSEVVKQQMKDKAAEPPGFMLTEIADSARDLVSSMRDIVWAIDPRQDDLGNVIFRMRRFALDVLEAQYVKVDFQAPLASDKIKLNPDQRRHLLLIFKEGVNNIARHAASDSVSINIKTSQGRLTMDIRDDGRGFAEMSSQGPHTNSASGGHGLGNMQRRAAELGGKLTVSSASGEGTAVSLTIPLRKP